jgi:hypothetical protein
MDIKNTHSLQILWIQAYCEHIKYAVWKFNTKKYGLIYSA